MALNSKSPRRDFRELVWTLPRSESDWRLLACTKLGWKDYIRPPSVGLIAPPPKKKCKIWEASWRPRSWRELNQKKELQNSESERAGA